MDNGLVIFNPEVYFLINCIKKEKFKTKGQVYEHYLKNNNHLYSNLNINPKYRRQVDKILKLEFYQKYIYPVKNGREMYLDLINRLQYTSMFKSILDYSYQTDFLLSFYQKSGIDKITRENYVIIKKYEKAFFQALAIKYLNSSYANHLFLKYEDYYLSDEISLIVNLIHQELDTLISNRQPKYLEIELEMNSKPILLIKCHHLKYWQLALFFEQMYKEKYFILFDYPYSDKNFENKQSQLSLYYSFIPENILYLGNLESLQSTIIYDKSSGVNQWYYLDNCQNIDLYLIPLLRQFSLILTKSEIELKEVKSKLFYNCNVHLTQINYSVYNKAICIDTNTNIQTLDSSFLWIYLFETPPLEFYQWCHELESLELPIRFLLPLSNDNENNRKNNENNNIIYTLWYEITNSLLWNQCNVFMSFNRCLSYQVYLAIANKQLLLVPSDNCCLKSNICKFIIVENDGKIDLKQLTDEVKKILNLKRVKTLDNSKTLNKIVKKNIEIVFS